MIKAYYIMREDLQMTQAKFGVQIGHGTDIIWSVTSEHPTDNIMKWVEEFHRRKIVLKISTLEKLNNLKDYLTESRILFFDIIDNGLTEFNGKTLTGIVIPPYYEDEVLQRLSKWRRLQLWK